MAADDIARGALHLIRWGKKLVPATDDDIKLLGKNAPRFSNLLDAIENMSNEAYNIVGPAWRSSASSGRRDEALYLARMATVSDPELNAQANLATRAAHNALGGGAEGLAGFDAAASEIVSDLIAPQTYRTLTNPLAAARRFDRTVPNAPEGFTNAARTLGERGLVSGPKDIELARRISMLPPNIQDVYFNLLQEGSDPMAMLAAMKLLG